MAMATLPNPTDAVPETLLWCGVLNQAISDIKGGANSCRKPRDVRAARAWIGSRDFFMVCNLAGFEPLLALALFEGLIDAQA